MTTSRHTIAVLSGAGISAESGLKTFRDSNGLWEGHDVMAVASPEGWRRNPQLVLDFYNQRRGQLLTVAPNPAHTALKRLEDFFEVTIITQNVDDLHERAGSSRVIHLHGELLKSRSVYDDRITFDCRRDILYGDTAPDGGQLRPHIVWFGEPVPMMEEAAERVYEADALIVVGTSLQVYPAAGLVGLARPHVPVYLVDPHPHLSNEVRSKSKVFVRPQRASEGIPILVDELIAGLSGGNSRINQGV